MADQRDEKPKDDAKAADQTKAEDAAKAAAGKPPAKNSAPDMQERMEGMQGWMAEIEKRQERSSRFGGIVVLLAILASGAALALGVMNKQDAATQDDIDSLTDKVNDLGSSVEQQTETQLSSIDQRLAALEQQIKSLTTRQRDSENQVEKLQNRVADAEAAAEAAEDAAAAAETAADSGGGGADNP
jgi:uncharacterized protein HemX